MKVIICLIGLFLLFLTSPAKAQSDGDGIPWSINSGTMVGMGSYNLIDTYLSPSMEDKKYTSPELRVINEQMKRVQLANYRVSKQQIISVDLASTDNAASTATDFASSIDYTSGHYYHLPTVLPDLKLLTDDAVHGMGGFIYNTHNGNDPTSVKADIDLDISAMTICKLRVKEYPMTLCCQFAVPLADVLFPPHCGQSYYEVFNLGNASGVMQFNFFHNRFTMENFFTIDFPVYNFTIWAGYLNSSYRTDVNGMQSHIISRSFTIGLMKEFISFEGKRLKNTRRFRSAYY